MGGELPPDKPSGSSYLCVRDRASTSENSVAALAHILDCRARESLRSSNELFRFGPQRWPLASRHFLSHHQHTAVTCAGSAIKKRKSACHEESLLFLVGPANWGPIRNISVGLCRSFDGGNLYQRLSAADVNFGRNTGMWPLRGQADVIKSKLTRRKRKLSALQERRFPELEPLIDPRSWACSILITAI